MKWARMAAERADVYPRDIGIFIQVCALNQTRTFLALVRWDEPSKSLLAYEHTLPQPRFSSWSWTRWDASCYKESDCSLFIMQQMQASRTAMYMTLFRALENTRPPRNRFFADP